ncbi:hypothetical protein [Streptomyces sp. NPDC003077]|uniref:hypothetical protein n=1 Tax=Streptomyces sp. NPDC003077 TaxID=3154443 RepID=UPI0033AC6E70
MAGDELLFALYVVCGDRVRVHGHWHQVRAVRSERFATGGPALLLLFMAAPSWRVHPARVLYVNRC